MTLGLTFLSLMSTFWWKNYILNFKRLISLTLRDTLKRTPKVISNQNLFSRFQTWCWFWCWSYLNLCKRIKQSEWSWKFWGHRVFHYSRVGLVLPYQSESDQISSYSPPPPPFITKFLHSPNFYIIITWSWRLKNKNKKWL